jgi:hypothetical protein
VLQHLPASADAFVWLRLYQQEMLNLIPRGPAEPVWWTLRQPFRPLTYDAARMVFTRVNRLLGANWTLHDLRHSATKRSLRDPGRGGRPMSRFSFRTDLTALQRILTRDTAQQQQYQS